MVTRSFFEEDAKNTHSLAEDINGLKMIMTTEKKL